MIKRSSDSFINVTDICRKADQSFDEWMKLESSEHLLTAAVDIIYKKMITEHKVVPAFWKRLDAKIPTSHKITEQQLKDLIRGLLFEVEDSITWAHPRVAIEIARNLNPAFFLRTTEHGGSVFKGEEKNKDV